MTSQLGMVLGNGIGTVSGTIRIGVLAAEVEFVVLLFVFVVTPV